jgi:hypothetical protein
MSKQIIRNFKLQFPTKTSITIFVLFSKRTSTLLLQVYGRLKWNYCYSALLLGAQLLRLFGGFVTYCSSHPISHMTRDALHHFVAPNCIPFKVAANAWRQKPLALALEPASHHDGRSDSYASETCRTQERQRSGGAHVIDRERKRTVQRLADCTAAAKPAWIDLTNASSVSGSGCTVIFNGADPSSSTRWSSHS